jgi:hypothetical protein
MVLLTTAIESTDEGIVTLAVADLVLSVTDVAVNVTLMSLAGGVVGAV